MLMNHFISLDAAKVMTARFRQQCEAILKTEYQGQSILPICETYDRAAFDQVLSKTSCAGIRIYYGMDDQLKLHAIIVGVNAENEDILPSSSLTSTDEDIIDNGNRCPDICPVSSPLNS